MSHVDLGYAQECESWEVDSYLFPSKIGGKPAWLDLQNLPSPEWLQCENCHNPLVFLCQVYAPFEEDAANFHRTVFVFICRESKCCVRNSSCNVKAFRSSLPRRNEFYSFDPPEERRLAEFCPSRWTKLCSLCGCRGEKLCSKCKKVSYCSREHQVVDWKEGHKGECEGDASQRVSSKLFAQFEVVIEAEEVKEKRVDESEELDKYRQLERDGKTGTMRDLSDGDIEKYAVSDSDKVFTQFKERIGDNGEQILRYERGGAPLWIAREPTPESVPECEYCGAPRQFEFQIMPQILSVLHENELDVGVLVVYTCSRSCTSGDDYKSEFVFKQDVALNNL
jgi:pre-rRNA-processing protein TSR4